MSRLIDADALLREHCDNILWGEYASCEECKADNNNKCWLELDGQFVQEAPAIDAVEVVRCKDCIHWEGTEQGGFYYFERCSLTGLDMIYDDYCSKAERITE